MPKLNAFVKSLVFKLPPFNNVNLLSDAVNWYSEKTENSSFNRLDKPIAALKASPEN